MSEFTPSKWNVGINGKHNQYVYADDNEAVIAMIRNTNPQLTAAAPEMYELLKVCAKTEEPGNYVSAFLEIKYKARELLARIDGTEVRNNV